MTTPHPESSPIFAAVDNWRILNGVLKMAGAKKRHFRIYLMQSEVYFIRTETAHSEWERFHFFGGGLLIMLELLKEFIVTRRKRKAALRRSEMVAAWDHKGPESLMGTHQENFKLTAAEIQSATIEPRVKWAFSSVDYTGRWRFKTGNGEEKEILLITNDDVTTAINYLPFFLQHRLTVNVQWNGLKRKFVKQHGAKE